MLQFYIYEVLVAFVLGGWFVLTVLNQFGFKWFRRIKRHDILGLLPIWTFFAPNPGQSDYHCVYRDRLDNNSFTEWNEIGLTEARRSYSFIWNPEKRSKKVLSDLVHMIVRYIVQRQGKVGAEIILSTPYLVFLNVIMQQPAPSEAVARQFVILETYGFNRTKPLNLILKSDFHRLKGVTSAPRGVVA